MAAHRTLEFTLISAKDLKDVNLFSKMEVYAVVSLTSDPRTQQRVAADRSGGRNPTWNATLRFTIPAAAGSGGGGGSLRVLLRAERALGDRDVGEVFIPLSEILAGAGDGPTPARFVAYQVRRMSSGKPQGVINISYKLGEVSRSGYSAAPYATPAAAGYTPPPPSSAPYPPPQKSDAYGYPPPAAAARPSEPVTAYPAAAGSSSAAPYPPQPAPSYGYQAPQPQPGYGQPPAAYGYPPQQAGYGYAQQPAGYGYAPQQAAKPKRNNNFGMGLGAGLLGGALGGMVLGELASDSSGYDAGYDAGFDDAGGGFDF